MTESSRPDFVATEIFETANDAVKSMFAFASNGPQQAADTWLRISAECLRFASQRLAAQAELLGRVCQCKNVEELVTTETRFFENAADEYSQELDRIAEAAREPGGQDAPPPRKRAPVKNRRMSA